MRRYRLLFFLGILLALALRFIYLAHFQHSLLANKVVMDEVTYDRWAKAILHPAGNPERSQPFWQSPFYAFFLAFLYRIFGESYLAARAFQLLLGTTNCLLIFLLAKLAFSQKSALIALFISAAYGVFVFYDAQLVNVTLNLFLTLLFLYTFILAHQKIRLRWYFLSGLILGLAAITRTTILSFLPFAIGWLIWELKGSGWRKALTSSASLLAGMILVTSSVVFLNFLASGRPVFTPTYAGLNFYYGNNPDYYRISCLQPGTQYTHLLNLPQRELKIEPLSPEASRFWYKKAFDFIRTKPGEFAALFLKKLFLFWNAFEINVYLDYYLGKQLVPFLNFILFGFSLVSPLALCGIILALKKRPDSKPQGNYPTLLILFLVSSMLGSAFYVIASPYRVPAVAISIIMAAFFIDRITRENVRAERWAFLLLALFFLLTGIRIFPEQTLKRGLNYRIRGELLMQNGEYEKAVPWLIKAISAAPDVAEPWFWLVKSYLKSGYFKKAEYVRTHFGFTETPETEVLHEILAKDLMEAGLEKEAAEETAKIQGDTPRSKLEGTPGLEWKTFRKP